jgi:diadenylate cyclase
MMRELVGSLRVRDVIDVLLVAYIVYRVLLFLRGTRAVAVLSGLLFLLLLYAVSSWLDLVTIHWVLGEFSLYLVLAILVLFQEDIRRALAQVGMPLFGVGDRSEPMGALAAIGRACFRLADQGHGALIAIERVGSLEESGAAATVLDAEVSEELLVALFQPKSPLHDGAAILRKGRLWVAGAFLPLSTRKDLDRSYGTRHRAAMGATEDGDCVVFVVSEERRTVAVSFAGELHRVESPDELRLEVQRLLSLSEPRADSRGEPRAQEAR